MRSGSAGAHSDDELAGEEEKEEERTRRRRRGAASFSTSRDPHLAGGNLTGTGLITCMALCKEETTGQESRVAYLSTSNLFIFGCCE